VLGSVAILVQSPQQLGSLLGLILFGSIPLAVVLAFGFAGRSWVDHRATTLVEQLRSDLHVTRATKLPGW